MVEKMTMTKKEAKRRVGGWVAGWLGGWVGLVTPMSVPCHVLIVCKRKDVVQVFTLSLPLVSVARWAARTGGGGPGGVRAARADAGAYH